MFPTDTGLPSKSHLVHCTVPHKVLFRSEPRILVKIERTTRRHALARAVVALEENFERVLLGDFIIFEQDGKVVVAGPRFIRCSYRLGKRVEQEVLAAFHEWREAQRNGRRY